MLTDKIMPEIGNKLRLKKEADLQDIFVGLLERLAEEQGINKYQIYEMNDFLTAIRAGKMPETPDALSITTSIKT